MNKRGLLIYIIILCFASCKKETTIPEPIPGHVIIEPSKGKYYGYFNSTLNIDHKIINRIDTTFETSIFLYNSPVFYPGKQSSKANSVNINGYDIKDDLNKYYIQLFTDSIKNPFLSEFKSLKYLIDSPVLGTINANDNSLFSSFSNVNSLPLNLSNSNAYTLTLFNVTNCDEIIISIGNNEARRKISPQNPSIKVYASELINSEVGSQTNLNIELISSKDTILNNFLFNIKKSVIHNYLINIIN